MPIHPQNSYGDSDVELYRTSGGYGGSDPHIGASEVFGDTIDLTEKTYSTSDLKCKASGSTDTLIVRLYLRRTGTWSGNESLVDKFVVPNNTVDKEYPLSIDTFKSNPGYYRYSYQSSSASDTWEVDHQTRLSRFVLATS